MLSRTRETTVTFRHPFTLSAFDRPQPAGTYRVVIDEEEIPDITFLAFRRAATMLHTPAVAGSGSVQVFTVNADELAKALDADQIR
ncbi:MULTISPECIES: hypothetical protein [unclassified Ancylobacter]|jgi:hypothetical protein|uniref:hypothetical protein n=1 Tax=unclassified Ancylobacter TaxID=2626613 RepID=UPI002271EEC1|nr:MULTISPECIES: hypothetical protein [unclassified Ancylobacter]WAC28468.1 hypothetical protein OU996_05275 [Ancylobacter sp. SL191]WGD29168.1 hypothetical protein AncyloWKF20_15455 [Ancylobacter sp. WKF20]